MLRLRDKESSMGVCNYHDLSEDDRISARRVMIHQIVQDVLTGEAPKGILQGVLWSGVTARLESLILEGHLKLEDAVDIVMVVCGKELLHYFEVSVAPNAQIEIRNSRNECYDNEDSLKDLLNSKVAEHINKYAPQVIDPPMPMFQGYGNGTEN